MTALLQADAIVLEGGYVLFLVFRGDNTAPVYKKEFSPLHNRCLELLSKLLKDGHEGYWDNLYPSTEVAQEVAKGGTYVAKIPARPTRSRCLRPARAARRAPIAAWLRPAGSQIRKACRRRPLRPSKRSHWRTVWV